MIMVLLYVSGHSSSGKLLLGVLMVLALIAGIVLLYWQWRSGCELESELAQLGKIQKRNIEYEFVIQAMRLRTWHIDPVARTAVVDNDFQEKSLFGMQMNTIIPLDDMYRDIFEQDAPRVMRSLENICQGTISDYHETYRVVIPHTDKLYWEESYATIAKRDADGKPLSIVGTSMRIDDRKQMEEALVKARNRAEESDRLKSAFLANISHEIRTPLNAIVGFTGILNEIPEGDEHQMLMGLIQENSQKLLRIVDDVVNISKFEAGKDELSMSIFDLNMVLREQCDKYAPRLASGVKLSTDFAETQLSISSDRTRVADVIDHLLSNAVKFTQSGSIVVGFNEPVANRIRIWVRDTGKGIAPEHLDRIFERFFKVDEFIPGAGLGLSICRTMAYSLGGSITCESKLGEGSTFWLDIPIQ